MLVSSSLSLGLATKQPLEKIDGAVVSEFTLREGETAVFVLRHLSQELGCGISTAAEEAEDLPSNFGRDGSASPDMPAAGEKWCIVPPSP